MVQKGDHVHASVPRFTSQRGRPTVIMAATGRKLLKECLPTSAIRKTVLLFISSENASRHHFGPEDTKHFPNKCASRIHAESNLESLSNRIKEEFAS